MTISKLNLDDGERAFLEECRALQSDRHGNEVLAGLTCEESEEYLRILDKKPLSAAESERLDELVDRHEAMRMQLIAAEAEAREAGLKH